MLFVSYVLCDFFFRTAVHYSGKCVVLAEHAALQQYAGTHMERTNHFITEYCSKLRSGNDRSIDEGRLLTLQAWYSIIMGRGL